MGYYLNPGNKGFWEAVRSRIYVDKTGLISYVNGLINTKEKYLCVSRPRRFGKSMALEMLVAYYSRGCDSGELFTGRKAEQDQTFREHLNQHDVIFLNMQQFLFEGEPDGITDYLERGIERTSSGIGGIYRGKRVKADRRPSANLCGNRQRIYLSDRRMGLCDARKTGIRRPSKKIS